MNQAEYFQNNPPRCISGFIAKSVELPDAKFDGHTSMSQIKASKPTPIEAPEHINPVFALLCKCKNNRFYVHCYRWVNPDNDSLVTLSPLVLECDVCRRKTDLLDTNVHGYDSELGCGSCTMRGQGNQVVFECPTCGKQPVDVFVRFEFPDDLFREDFPEAAGREKDLFSWFSLYGTCSKCSQLLEVADFECA
jgi:hypothetical protein